ncbi:biopolymer transporter ExbD, partial [Acinetobacter baumannii]
MAKLPLLLPLQLPRNDFKENFMGMNVGSNNDDDVMLEVNMTPLIDVMLVLIIMFIITIPAPNNA